MLIVIRHAKSQWNVAPKRCQGQLDVGLTDAGRIAARARGADLPMPDAAYASTLSRARETAEILLSEVSRRFGKPAPQLSLDKRLAESWCGHWEGIYHTLIQIRWPEAWRELRNEDHNFSFPGGERLGDVMTRFSEAIEELDAAHRDDLALVVSHGGPIGLFLRDRMGRETEAPNGPPVNLSGFRYDAGSIELLWPAPQKESKEGKRSPMA